jgi:hypothetical protein
MTNFDATHRTLVPKDSLPAAAQRWLDKALPAHYETPATIQIEQEGSMDIRNGWTPFKANGIYTSSPLSFRWQARFEMGRGFWFLAEDGHENGKGWGGAKLWGLISLGKRSGEEVYSSQIVRNLGELTWLPGFALTDSNLIWSDLSETTFEVSCRVEDEQLTVRFELNDKDEVIRAYSPSRVYDVPRGYEEAPWHYDFSDHQEFNGVWIPGSAVGTFDKSGGPWEYLRVKITSLSSIINPD